MASKTSIYKHHCLSIYIPPSHCLLHNSCSLPSHWKIHHTNGNFLYFCRKFTDSVFFYLQWLLKVIEEFEIVR